MPCPGQIQPPRGHGSVDAQAIELHRQPLRAGRSEPVVAAHAPLADGLAR